MIIGNGLLAKACIPHLGDDSNVIVFASGVSNSREFDSGAFLRERQMLKEAIGCGKLLVYFSTCSISDPELQGTPYVMHKKAMEEFVQEARDYAIFRLPQVVGKTTNPNTLTNYLCQQILSGTRFNVWQYARRNLIDVDDVALISDYLIKVAPDKKIIMPIASPLSISIPQLVEILERVLGRKAYFNLIPSGAAYEIDSRAANSVADKVGIRFDETYIERVIRKYYGK